jgi:NitT/TauT family transport system permease protein
MRLLVTAQVLVMLMIWVFSPSAIFPSPTEISRSFTELWQQGMGSQLVISFYLNLQALALSCAVSLLLAYATVMPFFRPVAAALSKLRFLSMAGLSYVFTIFATSGHELKLSMLVFSVSVFFVTSMMDVVAAIPKEQYDLARTLGLSEWRVVWEVVVLGQIDKGFDCLRQNAAIGWMMLSMVEGTVKSEGGIGSVLLDQNHHFRLSAVFAIQAAIFVLGIFQDYGIGITKNMLCPYAAMTLERK